MYVTEVILVPVAQMSKIRLSTCMYISYKDHNNTMQVYSVTVMINVEALEAGQSSQDI